MIPNSIVGPRRERLEYIDALRGIASIYVVIFHTAFIPQPNLMLPQWARPFVLAGGSGVTLFFVVSAFCLCLTLRQHKQESNLIAAFYVRRFFRIAPLFYIWLFLSYARDWFFSGANHSWQDVLLNFFFCFNFIPNKSEGIVWASWTIGVEMVFYLLFPLIFRYVNNWWKSVLFFLFTLFLTNSYAIIAHYFALTESQRVLFLGCSLFHHLPSFAIGVLVFFIYEHFIQGKFRPFSFAIILVGTGILLNCVVVGALESFKYGELLVEYFRWTYWQSVIYGLVLTGLTIVPFGLIVNRLTTFFGNISYSVYLNHPTLIVMLTPIYRIIYSLDMHPLVQYGVCLLFTLIILIIVSYCTYYLIERPGIRLGAHLIKKLQSRKELDPRNLNEYVSGGEVL